MEHSGLYFDGPGPENTRAVLEAVSARVGKGGIGTVIVPSCSGKTALAALEALEAKARLVVVTHVAGFDKPNVQEMPGETRKALEGKGVSVFTGQHAFGGVGRGIRNRFATYQVDEIMAGTLRTFGQGTKVAVEIALMAADAGLVRTGEDCISMGGTEEGVDTALVLAPANSFRFFDLKVREVICKPFMF